MLILLHYYVIYVNNISLHKHGVSPHRSNMPRQTTKRK